MCHLLCLFSCSLSQQFTHSFYCFRKIKKRMIYFINKEMCYMVLNNIDCFSISDQLFIYQRCCSYKVKTDDSHYIVTFPKSPNKAVHEYALSLFSCVQLCATLWTAPWQPPLSIGFSRQEGNNTGGGCHALFQGIFPIQGLNLCPLGLLHWQADSPHLVAPRKSLR